MYWLLGLKSYLILKTKLNIHEFEVNGMRQIVIDHIELLCGCMVISATVGMPNGFTFEYVFRH